ncbi:MAG: DUF560 domain-containing protein [Magnetococcales bacterium]|nr:DUF560 domain-containing protein [Magnetococcales bacterium]
MTKKTHDRPQRGWKRAIIATGLVSLGLFSGYGHTASLENSPATTTTKNSPPGPQQENQGETVRQKARELLEKGDAKGALALLLPLEESLAGMADYDQLLSQALHETGQGRRALFALERMLITDSNNIRTHLLATRIHVELEQFDSANLNLNQLKKRQLSAAEKQEMADLKAQIPSKIPKKSPTRWRGHLKTTLGYDSNVTGGPDVDALLIPGIDPVNLTSLGTLSADDDLFGSLSGSLLFIHPVTQKTALLGGIDFFQNSHTSRHDNDEGYGNLHLGISHETGRNLYSLTGLAQAYLDDEKLYRQFWGGQLLWQHRLKANQWVSSHLRYLDYTYPDYPVDDARELAAGISHQIELGETSGESLLYYGLHGGVQWEKTAGRDFLGNQYIGGHVGGSHRFTPSLSIWGRAYVESIEYDAEETLFFETLDETQWIFDVAVDYAFSKTWSLSPSYRYLRNKANIGLSDYDQHLVGLSLTWSFSHGPN